MNRQNKKAKVFYFTIAIATIILIILGFVAFLQVESTQKSAFMLDTYLDISIYGEKTDRAEKTIEKAFSETQKIENEFSTFSKNSSVWEINQNAAEGHVAISDEMIMLFEQSLGISKMTDGAFDITIKPLVDLWDINAVQPRVPLVSEIELASKVVDYKNVMLDAYEKTVKFLSKETQIDFGAIAKGYAVEKSKDILIEENIKSACINYGGNIAVIGKSKDGNDWRVGIQTPFSENGTCFAVISLANQTMATSGGYERYFVQDGNTYHHIIDPKTGYTADSNLKSVSVICDDAMLADALSTAFFVMGKEKALSIANGLGNVDVVLVDNENFVYTTESIRDKITLIDEEYTLH